MVDRNRIERVLRDCYAARDANDLAGVMTMFADDASFRIAGSNAQWPSHFTAKGKPAVGELMRKLIDDFDMLERRTPAFIIDGDHVAVHSQVKIRHKRSGAELDTEIVDLLQFDDGLCTSFVEYVDTALLLQTAGL